MISASLPRGLSRGRWVELAEGGVDDSSVAAAQSFRILPIWWSVLPVLHLPVWFGLAIAAVLAATGAFVLGDAMRRRAGGTI
jgi:hypothetical protein